MRTRIYIGIVFLILLVGGVVSCRNMGNWLAKEELPAHADAMVMLMGASTERSLQAADLYHEKLAGKIWIVEAGMDEDRALELRGIVKLRTSSQARYALMGLGVPSDSILVIPGAANSTRMEAEIVREFLQNQTGVDTLLLISSPFHTRRASLIFKSAMHHMDNPPALYCSPSPYSRFQPETWWKSKRDAYWVALETMKLANFYLFERAALRRGKRAKEE